jgi:DNA-binding CsgD family transcriptional regulator
VTDGDDPDRERAEEVWVVPDRGPLPAALGAGLAATGWAAVRLVAPGRLPGVARAGSRAARLVLVAGADGRLPNPGPALVVRPDRPVVVVGPRAAWPAMAAAVDATPAVAAAVDADQPVVDLLRRLDRALRRADPPRPGGDLARSLRGRLRESRLCATLTEREQEVLGELLAGRVASEIAIAERVSLATVRSHIRAVLSKLGVSSQLAAVALARRSCRDARIVERMQEIHQF